MHFARPLIFSIRQLINTLLSLTNHNKIMNPCEALTAAARQGRGGKSWPSSIFQKVRRHNTGNYVLSAEGIPHAFCQRCLIRAPAYHPGQAGAKDKAFWTLYILWNFMDLVQARPSLTRKTKIYLFFFACQYRGGTICWRQGRTAEPPRRLRLLHASSPKATGLVCPLLCAIYPTL